MFSSHAKDTEQQYAADPYASTAHKAGHKLRDAIDMVSKETQNASTTAMKQLRDNPVQSSLIALGIGFVAGLLMHRRSRQP